jgi:AraC family transcriptional regulator of adaptative response/methylated-DNA-[protein]-cysteine methyltransferase
MLVTRNIDTPLGVMRAAATDKGICLFDFEYRRMIDNILKRIETGLQETLQPGNNEFIDQVEEEINEYLQGSRTMFDVPLHMVGSEFQKSVWNGLLTIPYGETRSYKQQSIFLGDEKAIRAVAGANGENGIAIIIPCHRVIGTDGSLTGYGGGLPRKKWLLEHEAKHSGKHIQATLF